MSLIRCWRYDFKKAPVPLSSAYVYDGTYYAVVRAADASAPGGWYGFTDPGNFFLDLNHTSPGAGPLNLPVILGLGGPGQPALNMNMQGGKFRAKMRLQNFLFPRAAQMVLLYQTFDAAAGKAVNYIQTRDSVSRQLGVPDPYYRSFDAYYNCPWTQIEVPFSTDDRDWIGMGAAPGKEGSYGWSSSIAHALSSWNTNMMIVIHLGFNTPAQPIISRVQITDLELHVESTLNPTVVAV